MAQLLVPDRCTSVSGRHDNQMKPLIYEGFDEHYDRPCLIA